jgi:hypothetical protein
VPPLKAVKKKVFIFLLLEGTNKRQGIHMFELSSHINNREKTRDFEDPQLNGAVLSAQIFMRLRLNPVGELGKLHGGGMGLDTRGLALVFGPPAQKPKNPKTHFHRPPASLSRPSVT